MFCTNCGFELDENVNFCTNCGTAVRDYTKENVQSSEVLLNKESVEQQERITNEIKLEQKFGVPFQNRLWFKCSIEEIRHATFSNANQRDFMDCYVILEDTYMLIVKESVILKSKMGNIKIFYDNIAGIDYDARGLLHLSNSLDIHLKSSGKVELKYVTDEMVDMVTGKFNEYMGNKINNSNESMGNNRNSNVDDLVKLAELYEKGLLTKEEFEIKKKELFNN